VKGAVADAAIYLILYIRGVTIPTNAINRRDLSNHFYNGKTLRRPATAYYYYLININDINIDENADT